MWLAQWFVAVSFGAGAAMKLAMPIPELAAIWPWAGDLPVFSVRLLGLIDLAGAVGIVLPALLRWPGKLTASAALGCSALQACAMVFHAMRAEFSALPVNVALLSASVATCIAYARKPA
ncbi:DoxX family protein [Duganella sp. LjRoot269]|uniref:DoxX family protein n=1 Tax=Duganella sp. LjRoot269 TaxID=3342305 RepID=UPI003ECEFC83